MLNVTNCAPKAAPSDRVRCDPPEATHEPSPGLELLDEPILGLASDGSLRVASGAAWRLLDRGDTLVLREGRPVPADPSLRERWRAALADVRLGRRRLLCAPGAHARPILLRPAPGAAGIVVRIGRDAAGRLQALRCYAESIGLTGQETRVLEGLVDGDTPAGIAARHGVSLCTVRTQIRSTIEKAGVRGTRGLVATVARVLQ